MKIDFPIRINRYLYLKNICSRREADRFIEKGFILVNGKKAVLGQKLQKTDEVVLNEKAKKKLQGKILIAFYKPVGVVSHNPENDQKEPNDFLPFSEKLSPIGRLDRASEGLLLLSNDGKLFDKMLNPKFSHQKEYEVETDKRVDKNFIKKMESGVNIEGYKTRPAKIKKIFPRAFNVILTEGKKHQIRRMCAALGLQVQKLKRIRFMNIKLGNLKEGAFRKIEGKEYLELLEKLKIEK